MSYTALTHGPPLPAKAAEYLQQREAVNRFREEAYSGLSSRDSCTGVEASRLKVANSVGVGECRMSGRLSEADGWVSVFLTSRDHRSVKRRVTAYDFSHRASRIPALDCEHTFD